MLECRNGRPQSGQVIRPAEKLASKNGPPPSSHHRRDSDTYRIEIDIAKFRNTFSADTQDEVFCLFNALWALGMIEDISILL